MTVLAEDLAALVAALDAGREVRLSIIGWERSYPVPAHFTATLGPVRHLPRAFVDIGDRAQLAAFLRDLASALQPEERAPIAIPIAQPIGHLRIETTADGRIRYTGVNTDGADAPHGAPCSRCMNPAPKSALFEGNSYRGCERCCELGRPA